MRRPVSDGMLYAPKLSIDALEAQEIKETGPVKLIERIAKSRVKEAADREKAKPVPKKR
jgi:hypothetical protein